MEKIGKDPAIKEQKVRKFVTQQSVCSNLVARQRFRLILIVLSVIGIGFMIFGLVTSIGESDKLIPLFVGGLIFQVVLLAVVIQFTSLSEANDYRYVGLNRSLYVLAEEEGLKDALDGVIFFDPDVD